MELVCARGVEGFLEAAAVIAAAPGTAAEKVRRLIYAHLSPLQDRPDFVRVFHNERRHLPSASRRRIAQSVRAYERVIEAVIKAGIQSNEFRSDLDAKLLTFGLLGMVKSVAGWFKKDSAAEIDRIAEQFFAILMGGIAAHANGRRPTRRRA